MHHCAFQTIKADEWEDYDDMVMHGSAKSAGKLLNFRSLMDHIITYHITVKK